MQAFHVLQYETLHEERQCARVMSFPKGLVAEKSVIRQSGLRSQGSVGLKNLESRCGGNWDCMYPIDANPLLKQYPVTADQDF